MKRLKQPQVLEVPAIGQSMCPHCGKLYVPLDTNQKFCSRQCLSEFVKG